MKNGPALVGMALIVGLIIWGLIEASNRVGTGPAKHVELPPPMSEEERIKRGCEYVYASTYYEKQSDLTQSDLDKMALCKTLGLYHGPEH